MRLAQMPKYLRNMAIYVLFLRSRQLEIINPAFGAYIQAWRIVAGVYRCQLFVCDNIKPLQPVTGLIGSDNHNGTIKARRREKICKNRYLFNCV